MTDAQTRASVAESSGVILDTSAHLLRPSVLCACALPEVSIVALLPYVPMRAPFQLVQATATSEALVGGCSEQAV